MKKSSSVSAWRAVKFAAWQIFSLNPISRTFGTLMSILSRLAYNLIPLFLAQMVLVFSSGKAPQGMLEEALPIMWWMVSLHFGAFLLRRVKDVFAIRADARYFALSHQRLFEQLRARSWRFHSDSMIGSLSRSMTRLVDAADDLLMMFEREFVPFAIVLGTSLIVVWRQSLLLGVFVTVWIFGTMALTYVLYLWQRKYSDARYAADSAFTGRIGDTLGNIQASWIFSSEKQELKNLRPHSEEFIRAMKKDWWTGSVIWGSVDLSVLLCIGGLGFSILHMYNQGLISLASVVLVFVYVIPSSGKIFDSINMISGFFKSVSSMVPMIESLQKPIEVVDVPNAPVLSVSGGLISFHSATFGYLPESPVLKNFSLDIRPGEHVALVGPSGAGKSTVVRLILRFFDLQSGKIEIDGQDISKVQQESLRAAISVVPQEPWMFHLSVRENVAYGRENATDEQIWKALELAQAKHFVEKLPQGLDSVVGERGVKLSGGERQRLCIARAALKDSKIVILDEPTSALDSVSERAIQAAMKELMKGKTSISIAHRLSTIMDADRIVVMEQGTIAEQGTHTELLAHNGLYAKLWNLQAGGMLGDTGVE